MKVRRRREEDISLRAEVRRLRREVADMRRRLAPDGGDSRLSPVGTNGRADCPAAGDPLGGGTFGLNVHSNGPVTVQPAGGALTAVPTSILVSDGKKPRRAQPAVRESLSRRGMLASIGAAALGIIAAGGLGGRTVAQAADGDPLLAGNTTASTSPTALAVTQADTNFAVYGFGVTDVGLNAFPEKASIAGHSHGTYDSAVLGYDQNDAIGIGVHGISLASTGVKGEGMFGVEGHGEQAGVSGRSKKGIGVMGAAGPGDNISFAGPPVAVYGEGSGTAIGVLGFSEASGPQGIGAVSGVSLSSQGYVAGLLGVSEGNGPGLVANSKKGRGVVAQGAIAQLRLVPSGDKTHPTSGLRGDFFADSSARLWFCIRGGGHAKWVRIA
jgi:hypothetical protein